MSLEDLEKAGVLLPKDQWGSRKLSTRVPRLLLAGDGLAALAGCVLMYLGDGAALTWIGLGVFFVALAGFTVLNLWGVRD